MGAKLKSRVVDVTREVEDDIKVLQDEILAILYPLAICSYLKINKYKIQQRFCTLLTTIYHWSTLLRA